MNYLQCLAESRESRRLTLAVSAGSKSEKFSPKQLVFIR
jgi:hypothetical protein